VTSELTRKSHHQDA